MAMGGFGLTGVSERATESAVQDQTACMYSLVLHCILRKIIPLSQTARLGLIKKNNASRRPTECAGNHGNSQLTLSLLLRIQEAFVDSVDQDQTAQNVQSDL